MKFPSIPYINEYIGKLDYPISISEKLDGENTSIYWNGVIHARSQEPKTGEDVSFIKTWYSQYGHLIPENYQIIVENLYWKHSIYYPKYRLDKIDLYWFNGLMVFDLHSGFCLSVKDTLALFKKLNIQPAPIWDLASSIEWTNIQRNIDMVDVEEGIVVRNANEFPLAKFSLNTFKWVRPDHIQTDEHWMYGKKTRNFLGDTDEMRT